MTYNRKRGFGLFPKPLFKSRKKILVDGTGKILCAGSLPPPAGPTLVCQKKSMGGKDRRRGDSPPPSPFSRAYIFRLCRNIPSPAATPSAGGEAFLHRLWQLGRRGGAKRSAMPPRPWRYAPSPTPTTTSKQTARRQGREFKRLFRLPARGNPKFVPEDCVILPAGWQKTGQTFFSIT